MLIQHRNLPEKYPSNKQFRKKKTSPKTLNLVFLRSFASDMYIFLRAISSSDSEYANDYLKICFSYGFKETLLLKVYIRDRSRVKNFEGPEDAGSIGSSAVHLR